MKSRTIVGIPFRRWHLCAGCPVHAQVPESPRARCASWGRVGSVTDIRAMAGAADRIGTRQLSSARTMPLAGT